MFYYVYQLRRSDEILPFYIGKGSGNRLNVHFMPCSLRANTHKNNKIRKALDEGILLLAEIIHENLSHKEAIVLEIEWIAKLGRIENGGCLVNHTDGGDGVSGYRMPDNVRDKISKSNKGKIRSAETKEKMSNSFKKRKLSTVQKERLRATNLGRKHTVETRERMAAAKIGRERPGVGLKISKSLLGGKHEPERIETNTFSQWDRNSSWYHSDAIYLDWVAEERPGLHRFKKKHPGLKIDTMVSRFVRGWIPSEDPVWNRYRESRS